MGYRRGMDPSVERRIARLERSLRLHRLAVVLVGLAAVTCGSGVTANYGLVRTARLQIVDGNDQAQMTMSAAGGGTMTFTGPEGPVTLDAATVERLAAAAPATGTP